jgi:ribonuclease T1
MKTLRLILLFGLFLFLGYVKYSSITSVHGPGPSNPESQSITPAATDSAVPQKALQVLNIVRNTGHAPDGYVGGRVFENRESRLPGDGSYREFDVDPHNGNRNAERIIVEWNTKKAWYTGDHYQTFTPLP